LRHLAAPILLFRRRHDRFCRVFHRVAARFERLQPLRHCLRGRFLSGRLRLFADGFHCGNALRNARRDGLSSVREDAATLNFLDFAAGLFDAHNATARDPHAALCPAFCRLADFLGVVRIGVEFDLVLDPLARNAVRQLCLAAIAPLALLELQELR
jgi:hypothetical protein